MRESEPRAVIERLARDVGRRTDGSLSPDAVEAVDVVNHALVYSGHPDGRRVWTDVIRTGRLTEEAEQAVTTLVDGINQAVRMGDVSDIVEICDCLALIFEPHSDAGNDAVDR